MSVILCIYSLLATFVLLLTGQRREIGGHKSSSDLDILAVQGLVIYTHISRSRYSCSHITWRPPIMKSWAWAVLRSKEWVRIIWALYNAWLAVKPAALDNSRASGMVLILAKSSYKPQSTFTWIETLGPDVYDNATPYWYSSQFSAVDPRQ